jgi:hypothetical protein
VATRPTLAREQILAFRRRTGGLGARVPMSADALSRAAWAGLQDSMPRAALLSLHARIEGVEPSTCEHPDLVQLWGPRYSTYVVARDDWPLFTVARMPEGAKGRQRAEAIAEVLRAHLDGARLPDREIGDALGFDPSGLRYAAPTGTVRIRWDGARAPLVWTVPAPDADPADARRELARRYLHVLGPGGADGFAAWAGITRGMARRTFAELEDELLLVRTPLGDEWLLAADEPLLRSEAADAPARLLPSGDAYTLLAGAQRELLVPDPARRAELWPSRVWPGALLVDGAIRGTWRRAQHAVTIDAWEPLSDARRDAIEAEAAALPLPGIDRPVTVGWA